MPEIKSHRKKTGKRSDFQNRKQNKNSIYSQTLSNPFLHLSWQKSPSWSVSGNMQKVHLFHSGKKSNQQTSKEENFDPSPQKCLEKMFLLCSPLGTKPCLYPADILSLFVVAYSVGSNLKCSNPQIPQKALWNYSSCASAQAGQELWFASEVARSFAPTACTGEVAVWLKHSMRNRLLLFFSFAKELYLVSCGTTHQ